MRRKLAMVGIAVGLGLTGTAAAATIVHLTSAPVTETDLARCYAVDSLAGGNDFRGTSVAAAGPIGSHAQVTNALSACTLHLARRAHGSARSENDTQRAGAPQP